MISKLAAVLLVGTSATSPATPVDLNSLMYGLETAIADGCEAPTDRSCVEDFTRRAKARRAAMDTYLWNGQRGLYLDYQWRDHAQLDLPSAATLYPLFVGAASADQAKAVAVSTRSLLLAPGGLRTTTVRTLRGVAERDLRARADVQRSALVSASFAARPPPERGARSGPLGWRP